MDSDAKKGCLSIGGVIAAIVIGLTIVILLIMGPGQVKNKFASWNANWSGHTHWLVVQYTVSGEVMNSWEVTGSIQHEDHGDGVYFTTDHGIVHLSGHYIFVQDPTDEARGLYLKKAKK